MQTRLQLAQLRNDDIAVLAALGHHLVSTNKTRTILNHQDVVTELVLLGYLAPADQLGIGLEHAEDLFVVGNDLAVENPTLAVTAHLLGQLPKMLQLLEQGHRFQGRRSGRPPFEKTAALEQLLRQLKQWLVSRLHTLGLIAAFRPSRQVDGADQRPHLLQQVLMLAPATHSQEHREGGPQLEDLAQPIADQTRIGGVVNVGLDHERIAAYRLCRLGYQAMTGSDDEVVEAVQRLRLQPIDVVANAPPIEADVLVPVTDPHHLSQGAVLLGQILEFVEIKIATEPNGRQHHDLPIVHAPASALRLL